ncbi:MAG: hypothetical protein H6838_11195 [Planctomycetes bacterium]|nr:hypothetical protein [Planctomycetota bacterium]
MTASKSSAARTVSWWASWGCIPVCLMTLMPYWIFKVLETPSMMTPYEERISGVRAAMGYAGFAVVLALVIWRRASTISRLIIGVCVPASLYTLFVASWQVLYAGLR